MHSCTLVSGCFEHFQFQIPHLLLIYILPSLTQGHIGIRVRDIQNHFHFKVTEQIKCKWSRQFCQYSRWSPCNRWSQVLEPTLVFSCNLSSFINATTWPSVKGAGAYVDLRVTAQPLKGCANSNKLKQSRTNLRKVAQTRRNLRKDAQTCADLCKVAQSHAKSRKLAQTRKNARKVTQTRANSLKVAQTHAKLHKLAQSCTT